MLNLEQIKEKLQDRKLMVVSEKTGVHYNTLKNILDGKNTNPTIRVIEAISNYLEE